MAGNVGAFWGILGVLLLLGSAIYRLLPTAIDSFIYIFNWRHWLFLGCILTFMGYAEGYRGFQKGFSPRVAARARYLKSHRSVLHLLLAPLFCMAYFHTTRRRRITSIGVTAGIIVLIVLVRIVPQPWRGIVDAGVVLGLGWGLVSLIVFGLRAMTSKKFDYSPEVPENDRI